MIKAFVVIGLGAVIVFAPLAAMAQSACRAIPTRRAASISEESSLSETGGA